MLPATFYVNAGDELFVPTVAHPFEDAGADIRAHVKDKPSEAELVTFFLACRTDQLFINGAPLKCNDSQEFSNFVNRLDGAFLLSPGESRLINAGFKILMPSFHSLGAPWSSMLPVYKIVSRSGLAAKHRIVVTNAPGIVDSGYQDWVKVSLSNYGKGYHVFSCGTRIAQGLLEMVVDQTLGETTNNMEAFQASSRSTGGFGSTQLH
jgi:dUTP pyrophosphatase